MVSQRSSPCLRLPLFRNFPVGALIDTLYRGFLQWSFLAKTMIGRSNHVSHHSQGKCDQYDACGGLHTVGPENGPASKPRCTSRIPTLRCPATSHPVTQRRERPEPVCNFSPSTFPFPAISSPVNPPATTSPRSMRSWTLANTFSFSFTAIDCSPLREIYWKIPG